MRLLNLKVLVILLTAVSFFIGKAQNVFAVAPEVTGEVIFENDNRPIPGIWIKWQDTLGDVRYAQTGDDGKFSFLPWQRDGGSHQEEERNHAIDPNYDGVAETFQAVVRLNYDGRAFGCGENTHTYTILPKQDMECAPPTIPLNMSNSDSSVFIGTFKCNQTSLYCPDNIRATCDATNPAVTIEWNPADRATSYEFKLDRFPYDNDPDSGDQIGFGNFVKYSTGISLEVQYQFTIRSVRDENGTITRSENCSREFVCPGGGGGGGPKEPAASLGSCLAPDATTDPYYLYTIYNINTFGFPFYESRLMLPFSLNAQTQQMLDFLSQTTNSSTADFSLWNEQGREKQTGDYFGFYLHTFTNLPATNQLSYQIKPDTQIGKTTMGQFRQFLLDNSLSLPQSVQANMTTKYGELGRLFNSYIPAPKKLDLSNDFDKMCEDIPTCTLGTCPTITIIDPAEGETVSPVNNQFTIDWTATGAAPDTQYEVLLYDKAAYSSPNQAYAAYTAGLATPPPPTNLKYYSTTSTAQTVTMNHISGISPANLSVAIRTSVNTCNVNAPTQPCAWVGQDITLGFTVSGKFYLENASCTPATLVPLTGSIAVTGSQDSVASFISKSSYDGSLTLPQNNSSYQLQLRLDDTAYACKNICGQGLDCIKSGITPTNPIADFFVKDNTIFTNSWWNVYGGHVFANGNENGTAIKSILPNPSASGDKYLIEPQIGEDLTSTGIPIINQGDFQIGEGGYLTHRDPQLQVIGAAIALPTNADYQFFKDAVGQILPNIEVATVNDPAAQMGTISQDDLKIHYRDSDLTFSPSNAWQIPAGEHHLVLVHGNLTFSGTNASDPDAASLVVTPVGATVTFAVSGTITIDGSVGNSNTSSYATNLQGIFVANQIVIADSPAGQDRRFIGEGSFYGWSGVELNRQYDDTDLNADYPTETFIYRPDFVINYPEALRNSSLTWREVN